MIKLNMLARVRHDVTTVEKQFCNYGNSVTFVCIVTHMYMWDMVQTDTDVLMDALRAWTPELLFQTLYRSLLVSSHLVSSFCTRSLLPSGCNLSFCRVTVGHVLSSAIFSFFPVSVLHCVVWMCRSVFEILSGLKMLCVLQRQEQ